MLWFLGYQASRLLPVSMWYPELRWAVTLWKACLWASQGSTPQRGSGCSYMSMFGLTAGSHAEALALGLKLTSQRFEITTSSRLATASALWGTPALVWRTWRRRVMARAVWACSHWCAVLWQRLCWVLPPLPGAARGKGSGVTELRHGQCQASKVHVCELTAAMDMKCCGRAKELAASTDRLSSLPRMTDLSPITDSV